uniref:SUEL-type lectin domain-containing protein n=1 Tax=Pavo cristatus TaxID=9049 RepID=A0A8C9F6N9_PAVCR
MLQPSQHQKPASPQRGQHPREPRAGEEERVWDVTLGHPTVSPSPPLPPPDNHRVKTVCENNELRLHCRPKSVLAIYSAHYGRFLRGKPESRVPAECLAPDALRRVSKKCHRKGNCTVTADQATFGDPCLPGTRKQLRVSYTCGENTSDPFLLSNYMHGNLGSRGETISCPIGMKNPIAIYL